MADLRRGAARAWDAGPDGRALLDPICDEAAAHLGAAAWVGHDGEGARFVWPHVFSAIADEYDRRHGLDDAHLRAIAALTRLTPAV